MTGSASAATIWPSITPPRSGMAPSPSVFLAAVAQRTRRLRFGPLVYTAVAAPSSARRRGDLHARPDERRHGWSWVSAAASPRIEVGLLRRRSGQGRRRCTSRRCVSSLQASTSKSSPSRASTTIRDVPIELEPVQRPHPPLWYGLARPEGLPWVVANRVNVVCNSPPALVRQVTDGYRQGWAAAGNSADDLPLMGMTRTIVVAEKEERRWRSRGARTALASKLHEDLEQARHPSHQRLLPRQFRRGAADGLRHRRHARNRARRLGAADRGGAASTTSSAASPSATWRWRNRCARWSCSHGT